MFSHLAGDFWDDDEWMNLAKSDGEECLPHTKCGASKGCVVGGCLINVPRQMLRAWPHPKDIQSMDEILKWGHWEKPRPRIREKEKWK
eukprot:scaffold13207_cov143-Cylindrotheca_fusiformis.AAC.13